MSLEAQKFELERLGFKIVHSSPEAITAIRKKWYWDCLFTRITSVVFIRKVDKLSAESIQADRERLTSEAKQIDSSLLPRGFQKGVAVLPLYLADQVEESARELCCSKPKVRFAFFYLPSAREEKTGALYYLQKTPLWGALYYGKFRFLIERLFNPVGTPISEPLSKVGVGLTVFISLLILLELAVLFKF